MAHTCSTLIITCMDFRLGEPIYNFAKEQGISKDYDLIAMAGGIKNLVKPNNLTDVDLMFKQIDVSANLHSVKNVIIVNHEDCGAYGGKKAFENDAAEERTHMEDMEKAKQMILEKYPNLEIKIYYASLAEDGHGFSIK